MQPQTITIKSHWEKVYSTKPADAVSWYQAHAEQSLALIQDTGLPKSASIIDVGGGASTLVDDLINKGFNNLTVLDLSIAALEVSKRRLMMNHNAVEHHVEWLEADITTTLLPANAYDIWHDRAVFHFLTQQTDREAYVANVMRAVKPGGYVIVAAFAEDGPLQCSGLPVMRYNAKHLHAEFGAPFTLLRHEREEHQTPFGSTQKFIYCYCKKLA